MAAENEPLLVVYQKGEVQPHIGDFDTAGLHESAQDVYRAAAEARRLRHRRKVRRCHHFLALTLLVVIGLYTRWFGLFHFFRSHSWGNDNNDFVGLGSTPLDGPLVLPDSSFCSAHRTPHAYPVSSYPLAFNGDHDLVIHQNTTRRWGHHHGNDDSDDHDHDDNDYRWRRVRVTGEVVVRQVVGDKKPSIDVEALSNDKRISTTYVFDKDGQRLQVIVDDRIWVEKGEWQSGHDACLVVRVTVWVPEAAKEKSKELHLKSLHIGAVHLGVQLIDNLDLIVDESARLASVVGSIVASRALPDAEAASKKDEKVDCMSIAFAPGYRFEAPETSVTTTASPIRGPWSLLDSLHIFSVSGSISVAVRPEGTADDHKDKDLADLRIETVSGSIGFEELKEEKDDKPAARPHRLSVVTRSGTAHGSGTFAQSARLHTTSGNIAFALAPHRLAENAKDGDDYVPAQLDTDTVSGKTVIYLLNETTDNTAVDFLESTHHAVSGSVELHYPASWVGDIHLKTVAGGSLVVEGKGVHVVPDDSPRWPPRIGRKVDAIKEGTREEDRDDDKSEEHRSTLNADTVSGRVKLSFPE
ncbi:hypothetical protein Sste5346_003763 [Sporothrix stenoceras]|uniref:Adhesin domain-containing protein n=1 Tax=Sporothrix stenoceras TaxID=5173 RepID=A0ABR3ZCW8_9PEZI